MKRVLKGGFWHFFGFFSEVAIKSLPRFVFIVEKLKSRTEALSADGAAETMKKLMADIRAAVMLIVTENRTALQTLVRDVTSLLSRSLSVRRDSMSQDKKR